jgi:hypothetical protein
LKLNHRGRHGTGSISHNLGTIKKFKRDFFGASLAHHFFLKIAQANIFATLWAGIESNFLPGSYYLSTNLLPNFVGQH